MGRGVVESGTFRTERVGLELRTSDPASTKEGEAWIRTDIAPNTDQLATLRFDGGASTFDVPIFDSAASVTNVEKVWRVPVGGTVGFIPLAAAGESGAFPQVKYQHGGNALDGHDSLEVIPDSVMVHGFEDQDLSDYDSYNTASEAVVSTPALHESYSLEIGATFGGPSTLYSNSGLDVYPQQGDSWAVKMRYNSGARNDGIMVHGWAGQSSGQNPSGLCVRFEFANRLGNGTGMSIAKDNEGAVYEFLDVNFDDEDVYRVEIAWYEDNSIQALLYNETDDVEEGEITATTSDYTSQGGIWWSVGNEQSTFYYDNADVSEL